MSINLVQIIENDLVVGTWDLSSGFQVEHRALKKLIVKYKSEFEELGVVTPAMQQPTSKKGGRKVEEYLLNEPQATFLTTLLTNNSVVRKFKLHLTKEFFRQRKLLASLMVKKQNAEYLEKRASGKIERRIETDTIKDFVEYAKNQGSTNASKYYMIISKMENNNLFHLDMLEQKFPNLRDIVEGFQLDTLKMADYAVARALREGMEKKMLYKDIYILARQRIEGFAQIIGKSPIQAILSPHRSLIKK